MSEDPRVRLAAERTLMAWIRTAVAIIGLGFVVARFGLFIGEMAASRGEPVPDSVPRSMAIGAALIVLGVLANLVAAVEHMRFLYRLRRGAEQLSSTISLAAVASVLLAAMGVWLVMHLLL